MSDAVSFRRLALASALAVLVASAAPAAAQSNVARVNGVSISQEQLDRAFEAGLRARGLNISRMQRPEQARDIKREALDALIRDELLWQQAQRDGVIASDEEVDRTIERARAQARDAAAFERGIARAGFDAAGYRAYVRRMLSAERYAQRIVEQRVKVTDAEIESYYRANPQHFNTPERLYVRTIGIAAPAGQAAAQRRDARTRIETLRQEIATGGDFDRLARQNSDDPTRQWGGALDPAPLDRLPEWMQPHVAKMKPGQLSPVIETSAGFHLLRLDKREPAKSVPLEEARQGIYDHLARERGRKAIDDAASALRAQAKVELLVPL